MIEGARRFIRKYVVTCPVRMRRFYSLLGRYCQWEPELFDSSRKECISSRVELFGKWFMEF